MILQREFAQLTLTIHAYYFIFLIEGDCLIRETISKHFDIK